MTNKCKSALRLDTEALALGYYAVLDYQYKVVRECETAEEAEAFIAEANGVDVEIVRSVAKKLAQALSEYRDNFRRQVKQNESQNLAANRAESWSWNSLSDEIKQRFPPPPERLEYSSIEEYEEASNRWRGRVSRNISLALQHCKQ